MYLDLQLVGRFKITHTGDLLFLFCAAHRGGNGHNDIILL